MHAVAHSPKFAAKVGIPQSVGEEFNAADEAQPDPEKRKAVAKAMIGGRSL